MALPTFDKALNVCFEGIPLDQTWPVIQVFGNRLSDGVSVALRIWGFFPYLLAQCPRCPESSLASRLAVFLEVRWISVTDKCVDQNGLPRSQDISKKVVSVELIEGKSMMDYSAESCYFFKISMSHPRLIAGCRRMIENGISLAPDFRLSTTPFEANINYSLRWMIDTATVGCGCFSST